MQNLPSHNGARKSIGVIGAGFAGMAASAILANAGHDVTVFEKNDAIGGRARTFSEMGFTFDMGPSWYWMPDVYERFFGRFDRSVADLYQLRQLDPGFAVAFPDNTIIDIPADFDELCRLFGQIETGAGDKLRRFIADGEYKYRVGMDEMVYKPSHSITEFISLRLFGQTLRLQLFSSFSKHARRFFKDPRLLALIEFPVLFLGAMPKDTPALYSLMNYSGLKQGTFYPVGGFGKVADVFHDIARQAGVQFRTSEAVEKLETSNGCVRHIHTISRSIAADAVIGSADYRHIEHALLSAPDRHYKERYWADRTFAPSCLLFYLGVSKRITRLRHHNLFFDQDFGLHAEEIYQRKMWPTAPLFYVCCPSVTDPSVAPEGHENVFILMPIANGLPDPEPIREHYYQLLMDRLEKFAGETIRDHVVLKKSYCVSDFKNDYNAYQGNAYGLANTLRQTAVFKPKLKSPKVQNLFFAGQLTVPGPGVPPAIISGTIAAHEVLKYLNS